MADKNRGSYALVSGYQLDEWRRRILLAPGTGREEGPKYLSTKVMNRRTALQVTGAAVAAALVPGALGAEAPKPKTIAMLVYPQFTALDLVGPHHLLARIEGFQTHLVWKTRAAVTSDSGLTVQPTMTLRECPEEVAILFVPGGTQGTAQVMKDAEVLEFLKSRGAKAGQVTSVCTGSLVLGAAGLLRGYRATTHWVAQEVLSVLGAVPVNERVVRDRNRLTGGGVTAGIDFGLTLAAQLRDEAYAKRMQLAMEYAPAPPFQAGPEITERMRKAFAPFVKAATAAARQASAAW
jgi:cyclohexyl-isocyanide hydratase